MGDRIQVQPPVCEIFLGMQPPACQPSVWWVGTVCTCQMALIALWLESEGRYDFVSFIASDCKISRSFFEPDSTLVIFARIQTPWSGFAQVFERPRIFSSFSRPWKSFKTGQVDPWILYLKFFKVLEIWMSRNVLPKYSVHSYFSYFYSLPLL